MVQCKEHEEKMKKTINSLAAAFAAVRAGRANPAVLDRVRVDYFGTPTPISQIAAVSVTEARTLTIQPWDASMTKAIEKAILVADIGINPMSDGKIIRLNFPSLNEERRRDLEKEVRKYSEDAKVAIRSIRRDALDDYKNQKKKSKITEDDLKEAEKKIQDLTDKFCKEIDGMCQKKAKELLEI